MTCASSNTDGVIGKALGQKLSGLYPLPSCCVASELELFTYKMKVWIISRVPSLGAIELDQGTHNDIKHCVSTA